MEPLTPQRAEFMYHKWRNAETVLSFRQYWELSAEEATKVMKLLNEKDD